MERNAFCVCKAAKTESKMRGLNWTHSHTSRVKFVQEMKVNGQHRDHCVTLHPIQSPSCGKAVNEPPPSLISCVLLFSSCSPIDETTDISSDVR